MSPDAYESLWRSLGFESTRHAEELSDVAHSSAQKWAKDGPTPPVEKMLLLMRALKLSPEDVERAIGGRG